MRKIFFVNYLGIALWGCSSGNQNNQQEANTNPNISVSPPSPQDTATSTEKHVQTSSPLDTLHIGMKENQVIALLGQPTRRETVGKDSKIPVEDWWYGDRKSTRLN